MNLRRTLGVESLDAFLEIVRLAQAAVAMALEFDRDRQRRILGIVEQLLRGALRQRREGAKLVHQLVGRILSSPSGTHSVAMPQSSACFAEMRLERITMSLVRVMPTIFCSRAEPPDPGICPSFCSGNA